MHHFKYNNNDYRIVTNQDPSVYGCIQEIVTRNEYHLDRYNNYENEVFLDIGANCGVATIILAKQNPKSTIYSFEPHKPTYDMLSQNISLNQLENVKLFNMAVSDVSNKEICLFLSPLCSGGNTTCSDENAFKNYHGTANSQMVKTISLDDILILNSIENVRLMKIDCEGAEFDIIYKSEKFKDRIIRNIVGEFHDLVYNTKAENKSSELIKYCKKYVQGVVEISVLVL